MSRFLEPAVAARVASLELKARLIVEGFMTGLHRSPYHGFSVEFAEHRAYNPGDELRRLDWKVLAKTDRPYIKRFEEETNLRAYVVLDTSASMRYRGKAPMTKLDYASTLAAALGFLMLRQRDAAGLMAFDERVHTVVPPKAATTHLRPLLATLERISNVEAAPTRTGAAAALAEVAERVTRRSLVVVISDLFENATGDRAANGRAEGRAEGGANPNGDRAANVGGPEAVLAALRRLRHRGHEVLVFHVLDAATERRLELPTDRPVTLRDAETGERITLQPAQAAEAYTRAASAFAERFRRGCLEQGIDYAELDTAAPFDEALMAYLRKRKRSG